MGKVSWLFIAMVLAIIVVGGCAGITTPGDNVSGISIGGAVKYTHDTTRNVGCWTYVNSDGTGSISCLPDSQYLTK